jgi:hypothetical protein
VEAANSFHFTMDGRTLSMANGPDDVRVIALVGDEVGTAHRKARGRDHDERVDDGTELPVLLASQLHSQPRSSWNSALPGDRFHPARLSLLGPPPSSRPLGVSAGVLGGRTARRVVAQGREQCPREV